MSPSNMNVNSAVASHAAPETSNFEPNSQSTLSKLTAVNDEKSRVIPQTNDLRDSAKPTITLESLIDHWPETQSLEPASMTKLNDGENFFQGISRVAMRIGENECVQTPPTGAKKYLPGMDVAQGQVGLIKDKGSIQYRMPGHYPTTGVKPWKKEIGVVPVQFQDGQEFNPIRAAIQKNPGLHKENLSDHFRQVVVPNHQLAVFQTQGIGTHVRRGPATYVYGPATELRGTVDRNNLANKVSVIRQTEDTTSAARGSRPEFDQFGRTAPAQRGHGTDVQVQDVELLAGSFQEVGGVQFASPASGFHWIVENKSFSDGYFTGNGLMIARDGTQFPKTADGNVKFADLGQYSRSTPLMEFKSKDNYNAICRAVLTWNQVKPELWETRGAAYKDPFDALEEPLKQALRDWLNSVSYSDALDAKAQKFSNVEGQLLSDLNVQATRLGVEIKDLQISDLRFPDLDKENDKLAEVKAKARQDIQNIQSKTETAKAALDGNLRSKEAELKSFQEQNKLETERVKAEETRNKRELALLELKQAREESELRAKQKLELTQVAGQNEISKKLAEGALEAAEIEAKSALASEKAKLQMLKDVVGDDPALLMQILSLQSQERTNSVLADAAKANPNIPLGLDKADSQEIRRMNQGHAPQVAQLYAAAPAESAKVEK